MTIPRWILLRVRNVSHKSCREIKTHISRSVTFFPENRAIYEIRWKSMAEPGRPQTTIIWRTRNASWTTKATDTHSEYVKTFCSSTAIMVTRTCLYVTLMRTFPLTFFTPPVPNLTEFMHSALQVSRTCTSSLKLVHSLLQWLTSDFIYSPSDITTQCLFTAVTTTATVMECLGGCRLLRR
jgi:hypothetical protein